jgi:hypothetical protein
MFHAPLLNPHPHPTPPALLFPSLLLYMSCAAVARQAKFLGEQLKRQRGEEEDAEEAEEGGPEAGLAGWGANKRAYYDADVRAGPAWQLAAAAAAGRGGLWAGYELLCGYPLQQPAAVLLFESSMRTRYVCGVLGMLLCGRVGEWGATRVEGDDFDAPKQLQSSLHT